MSETENLESEPDVEFDLKHRVTGAAVLLLLGVLVLPLLLGPPSEASKVRADNEALTFSEIEPAIIVEPASIGTKAEIAILSDDLGRDIEETVYISKITPLDAKRNSDLIKAANQAANDDDQNVVKTTKDQSMQKTVGAALVDEKNVPRDSSDTITIAKGDVPQSPPIGVNIPDSNEQGNRERELQAALAAEINSQKSSSGTQIAATKVKRVDVGWVVQVGLFTEKSRSIALIDELKSKGFNASSSIVDTNRGKKTGTRVWLGPFTKRALAISEKSRLKSKAGKEGFIRVYP